MTPLLLAQALLSGTVEAKRHPGLTTGPLREQVTSLLEGVGMDLLFSKARGVFFAHPREGFDADDADGFRAHHSLRGDARWVLTLLWMFLVYLPELAREKSSGGTKHDDATLAHQDIDEFVRASGMKSGTFKLLLGQLKKAGFVEGEETLRQGYRMAALRSWEMTPAWDRSVQQFRRQEWFRERYDAYLAERGLAVSPTPEQKTGGEHGAS